MRQGMIQFAGTPPEEKANRCEKVPVVQLDDEIEYVNGQLPTALIQYNSMVAKS